MRKIILIAFGLVVLSLASCHRDRKQQLSDWENRAPNYYVNDGYGYNQGGISPFWIFWAYQMGRNGSMMYVPTYAYRHYGGYYYTSYSGGSGRTSLSSTKMATIQKSGFGTSATRGSVSRGGLGSTALVSRSSSSTPKPSVTRSSGSSASKSSVSGSSSSSRSSSSVSSSRSSGSVSRGGFSSSRGGGMS